jgi:hypothetical protein
MHTCILKLAPTYMICQLCGYDQDYAYKIYKDKIHCIPDDGSVVGRNV